MNISTDKGTKNIKRIIREATIIHKPLVKPENTTGDCAYALGAILQLDRETCLLVSGMEEQEGPDLCVGNDGFIFKHLDDIREENAIIINRGEYVSIDGEQAYIIKTPMSGGFVPLGETLEDGSPHPAAGKGFLYCCCVPYKSDRSDPLPPYREFIEKIDIEWDGEHLKICGTERLDFGSGFARASTPLTEPVPFGNGNLLTLFTLVPSAPSAAAGIYPVEFAYTTNGWRIVRIGESFGAGYYHASEPSLRKNGGRYYAALRSDKPVVAVFESDDGFDYRLICEAKNHTVPRVLNLGLDGSMYLATNGFGPGFLRNPLLCYPWNGSGFDDPFSVHDENGVRDQDGDSIPFVDHAISYNVFLEGRRRHFLVYRVCDLMERTLYGFQASQRESVHKGRGRIPIRDTSGTYIIEFEYRR